MFKNVGSLRIYHFTDVLVYSTVYMPLDYLFIYSTDQRKGALEVQNASVQEFYRFVELLDYSTVSLDTISTFKDKLRRMGY